MQKLRELIWLLPDENRYLLEYLISFLSEVVSKSDQNRMNSQNLSMIFAPLLLSCNQVLTDNEMLSDSTTLWQIVKELIENRAFVFHKEE